MEIRIQDDVVLYDNTEFALPRIRAKGQDAKFSNVHWTWIGRLECRQVLIGFETLAITFRPESRSMSKTVCPQFDPIESWYTAERRVA